jgi:hypothetical protein
VAEVAAGECLGEVVEVASEESEKFIESLGVDELIGAGEADGGEGFEGEALLDAPGVIGILARQLVAKLGEGGELEGYGAGIGFVEQEEVEDIVGPQDGEVACAIGDGAVGYAKDEVEVGILKRSGAKPQAEEFHGLQAALEAPADFEEAPAVASGGAVGEEAGKGGEGRHALVELELEGSGTFAEVGASGL